MPRICIESTFINVFHSFTIWDEGSRRVVVLVTINTRYVLARFLSCG
jgi:hypothetical protein